MTPINNKSGFTLIEMVIYASLSAVILVVILQLVFVGSRSFSSVRRERAVALDAATVMDRLAREIRLAQSVNEAGSVFDSSPGRLTLNTFDENGQPRVIEVLSSSGDLVMREGGVESGFMSAKTEVSSLVFRKISSPRSAAVRIELSVRHREQPEIDYDFYTTAVMRESYAITE